LDAAAEREFGDYVVARSGALCRFAYLLCGDWHRAEDAVQATLTKLYLRWDRLEETGRIDPYARRALVTSLIDDGRRSWFRRELVSAEPPEMAHAGDLADASADRLAVLAALAQVPPRQRAVLVLRYWEDQSIEQVAHMLDCSVGTVKSQAAHGLERLRHLLGPGLATRAEEVV
jgi:RNA polymerase sigma-70 factor (sigma-E family)